MLRNLVTASALVLLLSSCGRERTEVRVPAGTPIVLISIDTLRSDRLPAYGYDGVETPAIDALRRDAILFERAYAHAPLTLPSHVSLLTGLLPTAHGVRDNAGYTLTAAGLPYLPRLLHDAGYAVGGAVSSFLLREETGLADGFDFYDDRVELQAAPGAVGRIRPGAETLAAARSWLSSVAGGAFFFFFHIYEPHTPHRPPEPFASRYASPYDADVAAADQVIGELVAELRQLGVYERALIVLLSDHGEGLGDHGEEEHTILLYRESLQVPLLLKLPSSELGGTTISRPAQLIDVVPTLVDLLGLAAPPGLAGGSLLDLPEDEAGRRIYAETFYPRLHLGWSELTSLIEGRYHYIEGPDPELYDLLADPAETTNLRDRERQVFATLRDAMESLRRPPEPPAESDPETRRALAALGYLASSASPGQGPLPDPKSRLDTLAILDAGLQHYAAGEVEAAVLSFERSVAENPEMLDAWEYLGRSLHQLRQYERAFQAYQEALRLSGGATRLALAASQVLLEGGRPLAALELLRRHADAAPGELRLRFQEVRLLLLLGRAEEALSRADELVERAPDNADALYQRGAVRMGRKELEAAERDFRRTLELASGHVAAMSDLAVLLGVRGRPREALALLRRVVELQPDNVQAARNLAHLEKMLAAGQTR